MIKVFNSHFIVLSRNLNQICSLQTERLRVVLYDGNGGRIQIMLVIIILQIIYIRFCSIVILLLINDIDFIIWLI